MDKREQRIRRMYRLTEKTSAPQFPVPEVSKQGIPLMGTVTLYEPNIIVAASRRARYSIGDTMDTGDVAAMLDAIIEDAFSFEDNPEISFKLGDVAQSQTKVRQTPKSVAVGSNTLKILQQVVNLTDIQTKIKEYVRDCLKYGDNFIEIIYNQKLALIDGLQSYHPSSMLVETERFDLLQDPVTKIRQVNLGGVQIAE